MSPASQEASPSVFASVSLPTTALATVISSPSRIQATPRATTMRVWNGDQGNRSMRAGMRLRMAPGADACGAAVISDLHGGREAPGIPTQAVDAPKDLHVVRPGDRARPSRRG